MALFQPTNITPDLKGGAKNGVVFTGQTYIALSWQVNGNSPLLAYRIQFFKNDAASTAGTDTGKVTLADPFYPVNGSGTEQRFSVTIPYGTGGSYFSIAETDANKQGKIVVTQWWGATDAQSITQRSASVFKVSARTTATLSAPVYANSAFSFDASVTLPDFAQYGETSVLWHKWTVVREDTDVYPVQYTEVQTSGKIWGAATYEWTANPLPPETYYAVFACETSNGEMISGQTSTFSSLESTINIDLSAEATVKCNRANGAVHVIAAPENVISRTIDGNTGSLTLGTTGTYPETWYFSSQRDGSATWNLPTIEGGSGNWGFIWDGYLSEYVNTALRITLKNGQTVSFGIASGSEYYDTPVLDPSVTSDTPDHFFIGSAAHLSYAFWTVNGTTCFWQLAASYSWTHAPAQGTIINSVPVKVEFFHGLMTRKFYLVFGDTAVNEMSNYVGNGSPEIPDDWGCPMVCLTEDNGPYLGYYPFGTDFESSGVAPIIREDANSGEYEVVNDYANVDGAGDFFDYGALNGHGYNYYLAYQLHETGDTVMVYLGSASPCFWEWTLIETVKSTITGRYNVVSAFHFQCNVASGSYTNRGTRNIQPTFTPYPAVFRSTQNSRQGTLTGLIGKVTGGVYYDSNETEAAIRALSSSRNQLFLRDRRGNLIKIALAGEISLTVNDATAKQEISVSVPWVETGPVDGPVTMPGVEAP